MKKFNNARAQGGFSLIELLLVLAIVAALAVAAFIVYPRVQAGRNATYESQVLSAAQAGVKALFTTNNYTNLTEEVATNAEIFPKNMNIDDGDIQNQWNGDVLVGPATSAGAAGPATGVQRYFGFVYPDVPTDVCIRLAGAAVQNFGTVRVDAANGGAFGAGDIVQDTYTSSAIVDLREDLIATNCKGDGGRATIVFVSN